MTPKKILSYLIFSFLLCFDIPIAKAQVNITDSLLHQGFQRKFMVHLPTGYSNNKTWPLVINLHGGSGNMVNAQGFSLMNPVADQQQFVVAWPQGFGIAPPGYSWADGRNTSADQAGIDDVGFILTLLDSLITRFKIDTLKVYLCGFSNGGFMVQRMACEAPARFAAMASLGSSLDTVRYKSCSPQQPIPMAFFNGTQDPAMPYGGGPMQNPQVIPVVPVDSVVQFWVRNNRCKTAEGVKYLPDANTSDSSTVERYDYTQCDCNANVRFFKIINGGHTWPGVYVASQASVLGKTNRDISGSNELWDFFKNYSRCTTANVKSIQKSALTIAPNPAMHFLRISVDHQTPEEIEVFNHHGQIILKVFKIEALNVQSLPVGWYYVKARYQHQFFGAPFIKMDN